MYHYIEDKVFLGRMKRLCADIVNQLVQSINNDSVMQVKAYLVGSGATNLITQNAKEPIDLDYNLCVLKVSGINFDDGRAVKEHIQGHFNAVLKKNGWGNCEDSTSVLSTEQRVFKKGNQTAFKIDLAVVRERRGCWERLIHFKTGFMASHQWYWNQMPNSSRLNEKVYAIKDEDLWSEVRKVYLEKKNMYLQRGNRNHPSFNVYIETINEIYYKYWPY